MPEYLYGPLSERRALITKDTWIDEANPAVTHGGDTTISVSGFSGAGGQHHSLIEVDMPANPYPEADLEIKRVEVGYYQPVAGGAGTPVVQAFVLLPEAWDEAQACWNDYATGLPWQTGGGDIDILTDWAGLGVGIIDEKYVPKVLFTHYFNLTEVVKQLGLTWGDSIRILLKFEDATLLTSATFNSSEHPTTNPPQLRVYYENPAPLASTIKPQWNRAKQKVEYDIEIPTNEKDWANIFMRRDTSTGVAFSDGSAVLVDFGAQEGVNDIGDRAVETVIENYDGAYTEPAEDTAYYVAGFSEDGDNVDAAATVSNEVSYVRPRLSTNGVDDDFMVVNAAGDEGANLDVREQVFLVVTPKTATFSINQIAEVYIDWGDGGKANFEFWGKSPSVNPGAAASITFTSTEGLAVGEYLAVSENVGGWENEVRKITALTDTVATLASALTVAFTTAAVVTRSRPHRYTATGSKAATCQLMNREGFQSKLQSITTAPDLQALSPVAVIDAQKLKVHIDEEMILCGLRSKSLNSDLVLVWNAGVGAGKSYWSKTAGAGTATFGDSDGAVSTVSFDAADTYTVQLQVADDGVPSTDTETVDIQVVGEVFSSYESRIVCIQANVNTADTVTIDGETPYVVSGGAVTDHDFDKGGTAAITATNLAAIIKTWQPHLLPTADGNVVFLAGHPGSVATSDATAFLIQTRTGTMELEKYPEMAVDLRTPLGTTGFTRSVRSYGERRVKLRGQVFTVEDREALERLNDGTLDFLAVHIDGSVRALYPLSRGAMIIERKKVLVPGDQTTGTTIGTWAWRGDFIEDSGKTWRTTAETGDGDLVES